MPKKTNKTSHVLSLLTNGADPEEISDRICPEKETLKAGKGGDGSSPMESVQRYLLGR